MGTDGACSINGEEVPSIFDLMVKIDKKYISYAEGYQFHGYCVIENIISKDVNYTLF